MTKEQILQDPRFKDITPFPQRVWLSSPTMHGDEQRWVDEAIQTNWVSTVGQNINEVEKEIADYICSHDTRAAQMKLSHPKEFSELIVASRGGIGKALEYLDPKNWKPIADRREFIRALIFEALTHSSAESLISMLSKFSSKP